MQCPSCDFHNLPGSANCARCGAMLGLATAAINVHPPRAGVWHRSPLAWWRWRKLYYRAENWLVRWNVVAPAPSREAKSLFSSDLVKASVPGWLTLEAGERVTGLLQLAGFLTSVALGVLALGSLMGAVFLGVAFAVQVGSLVHAISPEYGSLRDRLGAVALSAAVLVAGYVGVGWAVSRVTRPIGIHARMGRFSAGDVVWCRPTSELKTGDTIACNVPRMQLTGAANGREHVRVVTEGMHLCQVVATPGQIVSMNEGRVCIDGQQTSLSIARPSSAAMPRLGPVPADQVLVIRRQVEETAYAGGISSDTCFLVPLSTVDGKLWLQTWPLWRAGLIE